ncbi:MAG: hypothetical protein IJI45_19510 [Anaerolineaceae bacterium]|nr:hypothetical protein [Anaerolineaceae bacterium]
MCIVLVGGDGRRAERWLAEKCGYGIGALTSHFYGSGMALSPSHSGAAMRGKRKENRNHASMK